METRCGSFLILPAQRVSQCSISYRDVSVRLSVTRRYCVETAKHTVEILPPPDSSIIVVFYVNFPYEIPTGSCWRGVNYTRGDKIARFSVNILETERDRRLTIPKLYVLYRSTWSLMTLGDLSKTYGLYFEVDGQNLHLYCICGKLLYSNGWTFVSHHVIVEWKVFNDVKT